MTSNHGDPLNRAMAADSAGNHTEALALYQEAIQQLMQELRDESHSGRKGLIRQRIMRVLARAEKLKTMTSNLPTNQSKQEVSLSAVTSTPPPAPSPPSPSSSPLQSQSRHSQQPQPHIRNEMASPSLQSFNQKQQEMEELSQEKNLVVAQNVALQREVEHLRLLLKDRDASDAKSLHYIDGLENELKRAHELQLLTKKQHSDACTELEGTKKQFSQMQITISNLQNELRRYQHNQPPQQQQQQQQAPRTVDQPNQWLMMQFQQVMGQFQQKQEEVSSLKTQVEHLKSSFDGERREYERRLALAVQNQQQNEKEQNRTIAQQTKIEELENEIRVSKTELLVVRQENLDLKKAAEELQQRACDGTQQFEDQNRVQQHTIEELTNTVNMLEQSEHSLRIQVLADTRIIQQLQERVMELQEMKTTTRSGTASSSSSHEQPRDFDDIRDIPPYATASEPAATLQHLSLDTDTTLLSTPQSPLSVAATMPSSILEEMAPSFQQLPEQSVAANEPDSSFPSSHSTAGLRVSPPPLPEESTLFQQLPEPSSLHSFDSILIDSTDPWTASHLSSLPDASAPELEYDAPQFTATQFVQPYVSPETWPESSPTPPLPVDSLHVLTTAPPPPMPFSDDLSVPPTTEPSVVQLPPSSPITTSPPPSQFVDSTNASSDAPPPPSPPPPPPPPLPPAVVSTNASKPSARPAFLSSIENFNKKSLHKQDTSLPRSSNQKGAAVSPSNQQPSKAPVPHGQPNSGSLAELAVMMRSQLRKTQPK